MKTQREKLIGIYKITSPIGRIYIGQSRDIERRFKIYRGSDISKQPRLHRSFMKYGVQNHIFEIVERCTLEDLDFFEQFYIYEFKSFNTENGLNLRDGGKSFLYCDEVKNKIGKANKGRIMSPETKAKLREINTGRVRPQWERDKISASHKGKVRSAEHQANQNASLKRSPHVQAKMKVWAEKCKKKVINSKTQTVYNSAREAALGEGFKKESLVNMLNGHRKNWSDLKYL